MVHGRKPARRTAGHAPRDQAGVSTGRAGVISNPTFRRLACGSDRTADIRASGARGAVRQVGWAVSRWECSTRSAVTVAPRRLRFPRRADLCLDRRRPHLRAVHNSRWHRFCGAGRRWSAVSASASMPTRTPSSGRCGTASALLLAAQPAFAWVGNPPGCTSASEGDRQATGRPRRCRHQPHSQAAIRSGDANLTD